MGNRTRDWPRDFSEDALEEVRSEFRQYSETVVALWKWAKRRESIILLNKVLRSVFLGRIELSLPPAVNLYSIIDHF